MNTLLSPKAAAIRRVTAGLVVVFAAGLMVSACNTTRGAGEDISAAGKDVSHTATAVQKKL